MLKSAWLWLTSTQFHIQSKLNFLRIWIEKENNRQIWDDFFVSFTKRKQSSSRWKWFEFRFIWTWITTIIIINNSITVTNYVRLPTESPSRRRSARIAMNRCNHQYHRTIHTIRLWCSRVCSHLYTDALVQQFLAKSSFDRWQPYHFLKCKKNEKKKLRSMGILWHWKLRGDLRIFLSFLHTVCWFGCGVSRFGGAVHTM